MKAYAQKQSESQDQVSHTFIRSSTTPVAASHLAHPVLYSQPTIENQAVQRSLETNAEVREVDSETGGPTIFSRDFSRIPVHAPAPEVFQPKLAVNTPSDSYEQEADRISELVMRMPESLPQHHLQERSLAKCQTEQSSQKHQRLQTKHVGSGDLGHVEAPPIVHGVLRSPGQPLDNTTRAFMEPRFGHDFSGVRIHTDTQVTQSAGQLHASAYTVGDHIVFAEGQFAASTLAGGRLLAHELTHVVQGAGQNAILRRQPDPKGSHSQPAEARLRVRIVEMLEATKRDAVEAVASAIGRGDRVYLERLGLSSREVDHLLGNTGQFKMIFGTAAELAVEQAVRADLFLNQYVKRGPVGRVPKGVGKPDWIIETPSSRIPVDLMTTKQVEEKLAMWRQQSKRGKPKWYVEKGLNITYDRPPVRGVPAPLGPQSAPRTSGLRTAGRFLAREAPSLFFQAALMALFPPGVRLHNDKAEELSRAKLDPAVHDALAKQEPVFQKLLTNDSSKSIYANVTARLEYVADANPHGDLELYLKDVTLQEMKITSEYMYLADPKFDTSSRNPTRHVKYSFALYEPESVIREREAAQKDREYQDWVREQPNYKKWVRAQQEYEQCIRDHGTGRIPPAAGVEETQGRPDAGPCIPPLMEPMEGP